MPVAFSNLRPGITTVEFVCLLSASVSRSCRKCASARLTKCRCFFFGSRCCSVGGSFANPATIIAMVTIIAEATLFLLYTCLASSRKLVFSPVFALFFTRKLLQYTLATELVFLLRKCTPHFKYKSRTHMLDPKWLRTGNGLGQARASSDELGRTRTRTNMLSQHNIAMPHYNTLCSTTPVIKNLDFPRGLPPPGRPARADARTGGRAGPHFLMHLLFVFDFC